MSIRISDILGFAWSYTSTRFVDYYRHYFSEVVTVTTKSGPVKGFKLASAYDYNYINFHGIPYAKPPVGELRFKVNSFFLLLLFGGISPRNRTFDVKTVKKFRILNHLNHQPKL